jgi:hypothetical protein
MGWMEAVEPPEAAGTAVEKAAAAVGVRSGWVGAEAEAAKGEREALAA